LSDRLAGAPCSTPKTSQSYGFFARRITHRLRPGQAERLARLLPQLALDLSSVPPVALRSLFAGAIDELVLEIGFGGGEHVLSQAIQNPRCGLLACDPFVNGMAKILKGIAANGVSNVRLHLGDGLTVVDWLPNASLAGIYILYPDPWPKGRHHKRRLVQDETVERMARPLRTGGFVRLATDSEDYAAWILRRFERSPRFVWDGEQTEQGARPWPDFAGTRYGTKAARQGRRSQYLVFIRR
jgi:tRNA (guanine-N7-)-methyltransferase